MAIDCQKKDANWCIIDEEGTPHQAAFEPAMLAVLMDIRRRLDDLAPLLAEVKKANVILQQP